MLSSFVFFAALFGGVVPPAPNVYVAASGSDSNPGTPSQPWASITKVNAATTAGTTVHFLGGDRFEGTLVLKSGANYTSWGTGRAVISGGVAVATWTQVDVPNNIWRATWNAGRPRQLYVNGTRVIRARTTTGLPSGTTTSSTGYSTSGSSSPGFMSTWGNKSDIEFVGFTEWTNTYCPVATISGNTITMLTAAFTLVKGNQDYHAWPTLPNYIENAYEIFTANHAAGTFYQDRTAGFVYLIPPAGVTDPNTAEVIAPVLDSLVTGSSVSNVTVTNLEFAHTTNLDVNTTGFAEIQANILGDLGNALTLVNAKSAITVTNGTNVVFTRCMIRHLGTSGIGLYQASTDCALTGNIIYDVSGNGLVLGGPYGAYAGNQPVRASVTNNYVAKCAEEFKGGVGIFQWWTQTSDITHNEVYKMPYTGISSGIGWGGETNPNGSTDNVISYNLVHDIMRTMNDGAGIYLNSHNPAELVHHNYIHHIGFAGWVGAFGSNMNGIYLDDGSQGVTVSNNVVGVFQDHPYFVHNNISDNVFSTNTADGGTYFVHSHHPLEVTPNTYDTLIVVSSGAAVTAGNALGAGIQVSYSDVATEAAALGL